MSDINISIESGTSKRLLTAGKYCVQDIVVTAEEGELNEDDIIQRSISGEYINDRITVLGSSCFRDCPNLTGIDCPNVVKIGGRAIYGCDAVNYVHLPNAEEMEDYGIYMCAKLTDLHLPKLKKMKSQAFARNGNLKKLELPSVESITSTAFDRCTRLTALILRGDFVTLQGAAFTNSAVEKGTGYVYVPAALMDQYKTASNWSTYARQIRALEDYTVDGTVTGELDETKI